MKNFILVAMLLILSVAPVFSAEFSISSTASYYLDDEVMLSMRDDTRSDPAYLTPYCEEVGRILFNENGANQPLLFDIGLKNQTAGDYAAACASFVKMNEKMTADDVRAYFHIVGSVLTEDAKNNPITVEDGLYVTHFFRNQGAGKIGLTTALRTFFDRYESQPNGQPQIVIDFLKPLFLGRTASAYKALVAARPSTEVTKKIRAIANGWRPDR